MISSEFYTELKLNLPKSTASDRNKWALKIVQEEIDVKALSKLLLDKEDISSHFLWLLSEIGGIDSAILLTSLPYLLEIRDEITYTNNEVTFANLWLIAGIPIENEAEVIDLLFSWINSAEMNVTTKSRSLFVLKKLTKKHPDLKNELRLYLESQIDSNTEDYKKRVMKMLGELNEG